MRDVRLLRVRRHGEERHAEAVLVERSGLALIERREQHRLEAVGLAGGGGQDVIVDAAVLVVRDEENGGAPLGAGRDGVDDLPHELLPDLDLGRRVLVVARRGLVQVVAVDERDGGEVAALRVGEELRELLHRADAVASADAEREDDPLRRGAHVRVPVEADASNRELVEDDDGGLGRRIRGDVGERVARQTEARRRVEVHPVRVRRAEEGAVIVVRHRERAVDVVVERDVGLVVPPHRALAAELRRGDARRRLAHVAHAIVHVVEAVVQPLVVLGVRATPRVTGVEEAELRRVLPRMRRERGVARIGARAAVDLVLRVVRVARRRGRRFDGVRDALRRLVLREVAEVAVEGPVLLREHDDVLDGDVLVERRARPERLRRHRAASEGARRPACGSGVVGRLGVGLVPRGRNGEHHRRRA